MDNENTPVVVDRARSLHVFQGFKDHFNDHRTSTELTMLEVLRKSYPDFTIACSLPTNCDLFEYAKAGHANIMRDPEDILDATRIWKAPSRNLQRKQGTLSDEVRFGRYK